jgi:hypothetical protein
LDNEHVRATYGLIETTVNLTVREFPGVRLGEVNAQLLGDVLGELGVTGPRHEHETALGEGLHGASVQGQRRQNL